MCRHIICGDCLDKLDDFKHTKCPYCQQDLPPKQIFKSVFKDINDWARGLLQNVQIQVGSDNLIDDRFGEWMAIWDALNP